MQKPPDCLNLNVVCNNSTNNHICKENCKEDCTRQETNIVQNCSKSCIEVKILSHLTSTLRINATFVFSNDTKIRNLPLNLVLSFMQSNHTIAGVGLKIEKTKNDVQVLKYQVFDGNVDTCIVKGSVVVSSGTTPVFSLKISITVQINVIKQKFLALVSLLDRNQSKTIIHHHSPTVNLTNSFDHLDKKIKFLISRTNTSYAQRIDIDDIIRNPISMG